MLNEKVLQIFPSVQVQLCYTYQILEYATTEFDY
jgi:hypothetical protein